MPPEALPTDDGFEKRGSTINAIQRGVITGVNGTFGALQFGAELTGVVGRGIYDTGTAFKRGLTYPDS